MKTNNLTIIPPEGMEAYQEGSEIKFRPIKEEEETITISEDEYSHLIRLSIYVQDWCPRYVECEKCGHYHPEGYICLDCKEKEIK